MDRLEQQAQRYTALEERQRRTIYLLVRGAHRPVTRDEVASGLGISRNLAAFHLERLLDAGLLVADYARPPGRGGPGSGRPAKRYVPSSAEIVIEFPARRYALGGRLLARAIDEAGPRESAGDAARRVAADEGRRLGAEAARAGATADSETLIEVLSDVGYEPVVDDDGRVVLANCPFHALAESSTALVCGMNEALVQGIVDGLGIAQLEAVLAPEEGRCCVLLAGRAAEAMK
jgi:predicted ArsR family transcriptional regulator